MKVAPPLPARLTGLEKSAGVGAMLKGVAVGGKLRPSELARVSKYVTESGYPTQLRGGLLRSLLIGNKDALKVMRARYAQGGVIGKGGLLRGELAPDPRLVESVKRIFSGNSIPTKAGIRHGGRPYVDAGDYLRTTGLGANYALHLGLGVGLPYFGVREALKGNEAAAGVGQSLGEGAGYLLGGPLGIAGILAGGIGGGMLGRSAGEAVTPPPPVQSYSPLPGQYGSLNSQLRQYGAPSGQISYY